MSENNDATKPNWVDPDDAPEWGDEVFERAEIRDGEKVLRQASGTLTRRGRPRSPNPKRQVTLRLDSDVLDKLRGAGPGWQRRINDILRKSVGI
jgi:uncharacterized protein (DUF4415 family)